MLMKIICLVAVLALTTIANADDETSSAIPASNRKIVCYYQSWTKYYNDAGKYTVYDIPGDLCTHVIYSFISINDDGSIRLLDESSDLMQFINYIRRFPDVKALVAIGGDLQDSRKFSTVVSNYAIRERFVRDVIAFLDRYKLDGLDIVWRYPSRNGGRPSDKENFVTLLRELKQAISVREHIFSAAVGAQTSYAPQSYNIREISKYLDFINIMTFDFNCWLDNFVAMNAPLYASSKDSSHQKNLNVNATVHYWISEGAPLHKIIVGIPFCGNTYTLSDPKNHGLYDSSSGPGKAQAYTSTPGIIGYNEMCINLRNGGWQTIHGPKTRVPYSYKDTEWISYDDPRSTRTKSEYVRTLNLGGVMVWSMNTDDFRGDCGKKHVLLRTINDVLK